MRVPVLKTEEIATMIWERSGHSYLPIPLIPNSKIPAIKKHNEFNLPITTRLEGFQDDSGLALVAGYSFAVIDVDNAQAIPIIEEELQDFLSSTVVTETGSGKIQIYFNSNNKNDLRRIASGKLQYKTKEGNLITVGEVLGLCESGNGTVAVCEPTIHPKTGKQYRWRKNQGILEKGIKTISSLSDLGFVFEPKKEYKATELDKMTTYYIDIIRNSNEYSSYANACIANAVDAVLHAPKGERMCTIYRTIVSLGNLVGGGIVSESIIRSELLPVCKSIFKGYGEDYLDKEKVEKTFQSALLKGMETPKIPKRTKKNESYKLTDLGNLERFVDKYGSELKYVFEKKSWYFWSGIRWEEDKNSAYTYKCAKNSVRSIYQEAADCDDDSTRKQIAAWAHASESSHSIKAIVEGASHCEEFCCSITSFDTNYNLLNVMNGTLDLSIGMLFEHRKEDMITKLVPVKYDEYAVCPKWKDTIYQVFRGNSELIDYFQRAAGYTLIGGNPSKVMFFNYGEKGDNGKSTVLEAMFNLLGDYAKKIPVESLVAGKTKDAGAASPDIAMLHGARMILASEVQEGQRLNESQIKDMTGNDTIAARFLHKEYFQLKIIGKIWMFGNYQPAVRGTDGDVRGGGIKGRIKMIPWLHKFTTPNTDMPNILKNEFAGVLLWMLEGLKNYQTEGLNQPEIVEKNTTEYFEENDVLGEFLNNCIEKSEYSTEFKILYNSYKDYCEGGWCLSKVKFSHELQKRGYTVSSGGQNVRVIQGYILIS
jgi:putative DNA primase/helicase